MTRTRILGGPTHFERNADGSAITGTMEWVEPVDAKDVFWLLYIAAQDNSFSQKGGIGYPPAVVDITDLLPAPQITIAKMIVGDSFEPIGLPDKAKPRLIGLDIRDDQYNSAWFVTNLADDGTLTLPALPATMSSQLPRRSLGMSSWRRLTTPPRGPGRRTRAASQ